MYNQIKSRIVRNHGFSSGVMQGENMSAFLFSVYLNELHYFFKYFIVFSESTVLIDLNGRQQPQVKEHRTAVIRLLEDYLKQLLNS